MSDMKPEEIKKAKELVANMRSGKDVKIGEAEKTLLGKYHEYRMAQPFSKKRIGKSLPFSAMDFGGLTVTNGYVARLNWAVKQFILDTVANDVSFAKENKMKSVEFGAAKRAEKLARKEEREATREANRKAREAKRAENEKNKKIREANRAKRKAEQKAKLEAKLAKLKA